MKSEKSSLQTFFKANLIFILAVILRILFGMALGIWFPATEQCDDVLMLEYASIRTHFTQPNLFSMVKYMAYPLFLDVVRISHLPYAFFTGLLWSFAALSARQVFKAFDPFRLLPSEKAGKFLEYGIFFYTLFLPIAFEQEGGLRMYRNGIIAPLTILFLAFLLLNLVRLFRGREGKKVMILLPLALGIIFTYTYYIKEDGIWFLAVLLFFDVLLLVNLLVSLIRRGRTSSSLLLNGALVIAVPLLVFALSTGVYVKINQHFFGVSETNTRTSGELGEFVQSVYAVDSPDQTDAIWSPLSAVDQVFSASETLQSRPDLYEHLLQNPWSNGDLKTNPLKGDYLSWAIRYAADCSWNHVWNEAEISAFFHQVNAEIDAAFESGKLKKTSRIRLLPSGGSKSPEDVRKLVPLTFEAVKTALFLTGYDAGVQYRTEEEIYLPRLYDAALFARTPSLADHSRLFNVRAFAASVSRVIFWIYRIVNGILALLTLAGLILSVIRLIRSVRKKELRIGNPELLTILFLALFFLGLGVVYAFSICWFSSFLFAEGLIRVILIFYTVSLPAILVFAFGFGISSLILSRPSSKG